MSEQSLADREFGAGQIIKTVVVGYISFIMAVHVATIIVFALVGQRDITIRNSFAYRECEQRAPQTLGEYLASFLMPVQIVRPNEQFTKGDSKEYGLLGVDLCRADKSISREIAPVQVQNGNSPTQVQNGNEPPTFSGGNNPPTYRGGNSSLPPSQVSSPQSQTVGPSSEGGGPSSVGGTGR